MTIMNSPQSQAKRDETNTEVVIGDCRLEIVRVPQLVAAPCGHGGIPRSLMMLKEWKLWNVRTTETTFSTLCSGSVRNSELRPEVSLRLPMWTTKGRGSCPASSHQLWVLFASPLHPYSQRTAAKVLPRHVVARHPSFPVLQPYLERSPLFAALLTI
jgi:hypothetical protein